MRQVAILCNLRTFWKLWNWIVSDIMLHDDWILVFYKSFYSILVTQKFGTALSSICHPNLTKLKHDSKQFSLLLCFRMGKTFDCNKCGGHHIRPINRNCKLEKNKDEPMDMNSQILKELKNLNGRMTQMEDRMEAFGSTSSSPVKSHTSSLSPQKSSPASQRSRPP